MFPKIKDIFKYAWKKLWENPVYFIGISLSVFIVNWFLEMKEIPFFIKFIGVFITLILTIAMTRASLFVIREEDISWSSLFNLDKNVWIYIKTYIIYQLMIIGGLILFIIPGFIFLLTYILAPILSLDKGMLVKEALKESKERMKGNKLEFLGFLFVLILLNIAGVVLFGVGILITYPLSIISYAFVYQKLTSKKAENIEIIEQPEEIPVHTGAEHQEGNNPHQNN